MKLSQFKFNLPDSLIAHTPANTRDESRLMVLHRDSGKIEHKIFKDVLDYFDDKDVMILNNTKVFPARMPKSEETMSAVVRGFKRQIPQRSISRPRVYPSSVSRTQVLDAAET